MTFVWGKCEKMFHFKEVQTSLKDHFNHLDSRKRKTNVFQIVEVQISHKDVFYFYFLLKPKCFHLSGEDVGDSIGWYWGNHGDNADTQSHVFSSLQLELWLGSDHLQPGTGVSTDPSHAFIFPSHQLHATSPSSPTTRTQPVLNVTNKWIFLMADGFSYIIFRYCKVLLALYNVPSR